MSSEEQAKVWTPYFISVVGIMFFSYICFHGLNSGTSVYISVTGGSATLAGILASVYSIVAGITRMFMGPIIDGRGRSLVMTIGAISFVTGALIIGFMTGSVALIVGRVFQGIGFGSLTTAASAAAADILPKSRLGEGLSYYTLGNALAQSIGPALGLTLVALDPPEIMYYVLACVAVLVFFLARACNYEKHPERLPESSSYRKRVMGSTDNAEEPAAKKKVLSTQADDNREFRGIYKYIEPRAFSGAFPMMFMSAANSFSVFFVGLYGTTLGLPNAGVYFTLCAITMVSVRTMSKKYMDVILPIKVFIFSVVAGLVGLTCLLLAESNTIFFYIAGLLYGVSLGITLPINQSVSVKNTPANRWGVGNAFFLLGSDIGVTVFSIIYGNLVENIDFWAAIIAAMCAMGIAFVLAWIFYPPWAKNATAFKAWREENSN